MEVRCSCKGGERGGEWRFWKKKKEAFLDYPWSTWRCSLLQEVRNTTLPAALWHTVESFLTAIMVGKYWASKSRGGGKGGANKRFHFWQSLCFPRQKVIKKENSIDESSSFLFPPFGAISAGLERKLVGCRLLWVAEKKKKKRVGGTSSALSSPPHPPTPLGSIATVNHRVRTDSFFFPLSYYLLEARVARRLGNT